MKRDTIFIKDTAKRGSFQFNQDVADAFDDMAPRSIPFYAEIQSLIVKICENRLTENDVICDLGCSTGTSLALISEALQSTPLTLLGYEKSPEMIAQALQKLHRCPSHHQVRLVEQDLEQSFGLPPSQIILMNLVLQFIDPALRLPVLTAAYDALTLGGSLILVEKTVPATPEYDALFTDIYYDLKRKNEYSEVEIINKRDALETILRPLTAPDNEGLLAQAGFSKWERFFTWMNFSGWMAFKS